MAITNFTQGFTIDTIPTLFIDKSKGLLLGASNNVSLSNPLGDLNIKPKTGLNFLGNINMGLLATMALPMVTGALKSAADKPLQNMTTEQRLLFEAIYGSGDSVLGDLFSMKQNVQNSIDNINSNLHTNTGALGSTLALADSFSSTNFDAFKLNNDKMSFGQGFSRIADSAAKGFSTGMVTGNPLVGGILAVANAVGSGARMAFANKNRNTINNAAELALNKTLDNLSLLAENTQKQMSLMNLANTNYAALGGLLNYNIDNKYLANGYMSKLNNRVYKPLSDSMNYFAMGGMPDFTEFNTGGTHELNRNGGIPQGFDSQGALNLVEQGEVKIKTKEGLDYILLDRLPLPEEWCKAHKVPIDSTPAEAAKYLRKEYDENSNDPILKRMWEEVDAPALIEINEIMKLEAALKEARKQGLNNPKMLGINPQVMQDMYYNENPQEEVLLQQGMNPNILNAFGGLVKKFYLGGSPSFNTKLNFLDYVDYQNVLNNNKNTEDIEVTTKPLISLENFKYAPIAANIAGLALNLFTPEDYSMPNRLLKEIDLLPRVLVPKNTNYMTYNPVDVNRYTNQYNANAAAQRNAIMNTSSPSRQSAMVALLYNSSIGYGDLVQAIEAQNAKEKQAVLQFNAGIDQLNIANQLQADGINQLYEQIRIKGIMEELALRDAIQTARANALSSNLDSLTSNLAGIGTEAYNLKSFKTALLNNYDYTATPELLTNWNEQEVRNYYKQRGNDDVSINNLIKQWKLAKGE